MGERLRLFYKLTKPGIIYGNLIHIGAGCLLAYQFGFSLSAVIGVFIGTTLIIASACVANNYIDRDIDARMTRTKERAFVIRAISPRSAMIYGATLCMLGFISLIMLTNWLVVGIGLVAYIFYVILYGWAKRHTVHSTLIGSIPGALPAMAGYVALSGRIDVGAWLVFLLIVAWQMPHFYAISLFRKDDYAKAKLPVLGVVANETIVRQSIVAYIGLYLLIIIIMTQLNYFALVPGIILGIGAVWWLLSAQERKTTQSVESWARTVFGRSLVLPILLLTVCGLNIVFV